jgi:Fic family protein
LPDWPKLTFDAQKLQAHLAKARHAQGLLLGKALTTSAIEGEKLDAQSVRSSIARRLGLDFDGVPSAEGKRHIEGLIDVLQDATLNTQTPLTVDRMCNWHGALFPTGFSGMTRIVVGALRSVPMDVVSGPVGRSKVHYSAPPADVLKDQVDAFVGWFNASHPSLGSQPMDGLLRAALSHLWFETLHPFEDGNGRIGRSIMQLALGQDMGQAGRLVTLSRQIELHKNQYYTELETAQRSHTPDVTSWMCWMLAQISSASDFSSQTIDQSLQRIQFQASMSGQALNERQLKTLKKLLDAGPKGYIGGMTTRKHEQISKTSTPTAARDLIDLEQRGLLVKKGMGRATRYYPAIDGWAEALG